MYSFRNGPLAVFADDDVALALAFAFAFTFTLALAFVGTGIDALEALPRLEADALPGALPGQYRGWSLSASGGWWSNESGMYAKRRSSCWEMGEGVRGLDDEELVRDWTSYTASIEESERKGGGKQEAGSRKQDRGTQGRKGRKGREEEGALDVRT
jgi:hypothetical protein